SVRPPAYCWSGERPLRSIVTVTVVTPDGPDERFTLSQSLFEAIFQVPLAVTWKVAELVPSKERKAGATETLVAGGWLPPPPQAARTTARAARSGGPKRMLSTPMEPPRREMS